MRGVVEQALPLAQVLVDEEVLLLLQVAQAAVHELGGPRRGAGGEIASLDQRRAQPAGGAVQRHPGTGDAAADDDHVELPRWPDGPGPGRGPWSCRPSEFQCVRGAEAVPQQRRGVTALDEQNGRPEDQIDSGEGQADGRGGRFRARRPPRRTRSTNRPKTDRASTVVNSRLPRTATPKTDWAAVRASSWRLSDDSGMPCRLCEAMAKAMGRLPTSTVHWLTLEETSAPNPTDGAQAPRIDAATTSSGASDANGATHWTRKYCVHVPAPIRWPRGRRRRCRRTGRRRPRPARAGPAHSTVARTAGPLPSQAATPSRSAPPAAPAPSEAVAAEHGSSTMCRPARREWRRGRVRHQAAARAEKRQLDGVRPLQDDAVQEPAAAACGCGTTRRRTTRLQPIADQAAGWRPSCWPARGCTATSCPPPGAGGLAGGAEDPGTACPPARRTRRRRRIRAARRRGPARRWPAPGRGRAAPPRRPRPEATRHRRWRRRSRRPERRAGGVAPPPATPARAG